MIARISTEPGEKIIELGKKLKNKGLAFIKDQELLFDLIKFSRGIDKIEAELIEKLFHGTSDGGYKLKIPLEEGIEIRIYWNDYQTLPMQYQDGVYIPDWAICYSKSESPTES